MNNFQILSNASKSQARRGILSTAHGTVQTPAFMPVGTAGTVKGITPQQLKETGAEIILANTYHLLLRPGIDVVEKLGRLHKIMAWDKPILTDSGGYQVFSLACLTDITDEGVDFASHIDGSKLRLNAEIATEIQNRLGADIIMCFDQCTPFPCSESALKTAVKRTIAWAKRCKTAHSNAAQLLFGIVQGGIDLSLREHCVSKLVELDFDGYAVGGLSVGEGHENMVNTVQHTAKLLPENKPRYLMGAGTPSDIIAAVKAGIDMFDCVLPTRNARNAFAFTENGPMRLRNSHHTDETEPVQPGCNCYCCRNFSRGTIRHFFNVKEMLGPILLSIHNITFYQWLMAKIRQTIKNGTFEEWSNDNLVKYKALGL